MVVVAVVLGVGVALVEGTVLLRCTAAVEEAVVTAAAARQWDEAATEADTVLEVAATTHTELRNHIRMASPGRTARQGSLGNRKALPTSVLARDVPNIDCATQRPLASASHPCRSRWKHRSPLVRDFSHLFWTL